MVVVARSRGQLAVPLPPARARRRAERIDDVFDRKPSEEHHDMGPAEHHAMTGMGGLVLGITVNAAARARSPAGDARADEAKRLRLVVKKVDSAYGTEPTFGYFLAHGRFDRQDRAARRRPVPSSR